MGPTHEGPEVSMGVGRRLSHKIDNVKTEENTCDVTYI